MQKELFSKFLFIILIALISTSSMAQHYFFRYIDTASCKCKSYSVVYPRNRESNNFSDKNGRIVIAKRDEGDGTSTVDSIQYDDNGRIKSYKMLLYSDGQLLGEAVASEYEYSPIGKLILEKSFSGKSHELSSTIEYKWDVKGRPKVIIQKYSFEESSDSIKFKYINDTVATMQYFSDGKIIATGKRIYNKKLQILDEVLENTAKGKKVHFVFKYNVKGQLLYVHKEKVIVDDVLFFGSEHYQALQGDSRKIEFKYDKEGRRISRISYSRAQLDRISTLSYTYF